MNRPTSVFVLGLLLLGCCNTSLMAQPASDERRILPFFLEGVPCLLRGNCESEVYPRARECLARETSDFNSFRVVGDPCTSKVPPGKVGKFMGKLSKFFRGLGGLLGIELSLVDTMNVVVIYAPEYSNVSSGTERKSTVPVIMVRFSEVLYFDFDSAEVGKIGTYVIQSLVNKLKEGGLEQKYVSIVGHTDNVGRESYNLQLSRKRAENASFVLSRQADLAETEMSIETKGVGESQPVRLFKTDQKSQANRRVEFFFSTSEAANRTAIDYLKCLHDNPQDYQRCYQEYLAL